jgi:ubiquinone/menaquinone biosynthesis C-methylase UbiE
MADIYTTITTQNAVTLETTAQVLEARAADPGQVSMREQYFAEIAPTGGTVAEVGCGTGPVARALAKARPQRSVVGIDPSAFFLEKARTLSVGLANLAFAPGDALDLPLPDRSVSTVVFHTTLCHLRDPLRALAEAHRVLQDGGTLIAFDADYATTTVATSPHDPLQACARATMANIVHDPYLVPRLPPLTREAGFRVRSFRSHGYNGALDPTYLLTIVNRGADALQSDGIIGSGLASALKAEAQERATKGTFFGFVAYASLVAEK